MAKWIQTELIICTKRLVQFRVPFKSTKLFIFIIFFCTKQYIALVNLILSIQYLNGIHMDTTSRGDIRCTWMNEIHILTADMLICFLVWDRNRGNSRFMLICSGLPVLALFMHNIYLLEVGIT
jgi:hypothetical protein